MKTIRIVALLAAVVLFAGASVYSSMEYVSSPETTETPVSRLVMPDLDPNKVVGRDKCAECHATEIAAWAASKHATVAFDKLETAQADDWGDELGIDDVTTHRLCISCHGTPRMDGGELVIERGNSCESCHGAAGGEDGWYEIHGDFGLPYDSMADLIEQRLNNEEEMDHRRERMEACFQSGMNTANDVTAIVKNCLECHAVPHAELAEIGHPSSTNFEFVEWAQGEVRHNFLLDPEVNAESPSGWLALRRGSTPEGRKRLMFIIGQMADLEFSLRVRSGIMEENELLERTEDRITEALKEIRKFDREFQRDDNLTEEEQNLLAEMYEAMDELSDEVEDIEDGDLEKYMNAANQVAAVSFEIVKAFPDGSRLPERIRVASRGRGDVYEP